jgi:hypothetical protein
MSLVTKGLGTRQMLLKGLAVVLGAILEQKKDTEAFMLFNKRRLANRRAIELVRSDEQDVIDIFNCLAATEEIFI